MDNALYVGLSRQMMLRREMDIVANNIANIDTTGFKVESLIQKTDPAEPAMTLGGPRPVKFVAADGVARDFGQGTLIQTGGAARSGHRGQGLLPGPEPGRPERSPATAASPPTPPASWSPRAAWRCSTRAAARSSSTPRRARSRSAPTARSARGTSGSARSACSTSPTPASSSKAGDNLYQQRLQPGSRARRRRPASARACWRARNVKPILEITRMIEVHPRLRTAPPR